MHPITKKQKILYILAAALFVLLALGLLFLLLRTPGKSADPEPTATPAVTAEPSAEPGLTIAGVSVDPVADSLELAGKTLSAEDCAALASLQNLTTLSLTRCNLSDVQFLSGLSQLRTLILSDNLITDVTPLASLATPHTPNKRAIDTIKRLSLDRFVINNFKTYPATPPSKTIKIL